MRKKRYRLIILPIVFIVAVVYFFSKSVATSTNDAAIKETISTMSEPSIPVIYILMDNEKINCLHGYFGKMGESLIRDSITPLDNDKHVTIQIDEYKNKVKKITYEVLTLDEQKKIDSGSISALSKKNDHKEAIISIKSELEKEKEYVLKIVAITNDGNKINYFTRIKEISNVHTKEKLDFAAQFHENILDKTKADEVIKYLEPDKSMSNETLSHVNIHSSFDLVSFSNMNPVVAGEVMTTIKEINQSTASIEFKYMLSTNNNNITEFYYVSEFFRVRWTENRMFLLNYERSMEEVFNSDLTSVSRGELKIGITDDNNLNFLSSSNNKKVSFIRQRQLWLYENETNTCTKIFSFLQDKSDYVRDNYDQHDIKILSMDDLGNINFIVYGYMNRDKYEGRVGIVLYQFIKEENKIIERAYIPVNKPYELLKEDVESLFYYNGDNVVYLKLGTIIYSYNLSAKVLSEVGNNINNNNFIVSKDNQNIILETISDDTDELIIINLLNSESFSIKSNEGERIKPIGFIGTDFAYGVARKDEVKASKEGNILFPMYKICILDNQNIEVKTYEKDNIYILDTNISDNMINLNRATKELNGNEAVYKVIDEDYIATMPNKETKDITTAVRYSEYNLNELYLSFPANIVISAIPAKLEAKFLLTNENTQIKIDENMDNSERYFVYAYGRMYKSYDNPSQAIKTANENVGVVVNNTQQLIWERGGKTSSHYLNTIPIVKAEGNISTINACIKMILDFEAINSDINEIINLDEPIKNTLNRYLNNKAIVLKGSSLDEVLNFLSNGSMVMAKYDDNTWVLIVGYDEYNITIINPKTDSSFKIGLNDGSKTFEKMGNTFVSYIR